MKTIRKVELHMPSLPKSVLKEVGRPYKEEEDKDDKGGKSMTTVIASAPTPDRYNDIVEPTWSLERFMANPVVPFAHDYTVPPVGRVQGLEIVNGLLVAQIEWDTSEENELGQLVASQFERGFLNAVSVGFAPGEVIPRNQLPDDSPYRANTGNLYRNPELLEISAVPIPAHASALAIRAAMSPESKAMSIEQTDDTFCITYAIGSSDNEAEEITEEATDDISVLRELFGTHPLADLFGQ
jgi:phage head maturation protease